MHTRISSTHKIVLYEVFICSHFLSIYDTVLSANRISNCSTLPPEGQTFFYYARHKSSSKIIFIEYPSHPLWILVYCAPVCYPLPIHFYPSRPRHTQVRDGSAWACTRVEVPLTMVPLMHTSCLQMTDPLFHMPVGHTPWCVLTAVATSQPLQR